MTFDFGKRIGNLQRKMSENGLHVVVCGNSPNFMYLTGIALDWSTEGKPGSGTGDIFIPREGDPVVVVGKEYGDRFSCSHIKDVRLVETEGDYPATLAKVITDLDLKGRKIGLCKEVEERLKPAITEISGDAELVNAGILLDRLRMIKESEEIEILRRACALTDRVMEAVVPFITEGVSQRDLELEIEYQGKRMGASGPSFGAAAIFTKSGEPPLPDPFTYPKNKGLLPGCSVAFDFGFVIDGYCSDYGRSFYYGPAGDEVVKGYRALHQAVIELVERMHDGSMRIGDMFPTLEKTLDRLGFGNYLRARLTTGNLGHLIGLEVHEYPWLVPSCEENLRTNMVMAIEPKIWHSGEYYLRVEDIVLVGPQRSEFLTKFDRELFQL